MRGLFTIPFATTMTSSVQLQKLHPEWATSTRKTSMRKSAVIVLEPSLYGFNLCFIHMRLLLE